MENQKLPSNQHFSQTYMTETPGAEISTWSLKFEKDALSLEESVAATDITAGYDAG